MKFEPINKIPGFKIGHAQDSEALTGCTVILCDEGCVGGVDQRGGSPGTRETDLLRPLHMVETVNAILLTGGSAFGLDAAGGVMKYLEEHHQGVNVGTTVVPIVPTAVLMDLAIGSYSIRPDQVMGYQACLNASADSPKQGNYGAGTGGTVGKILGMDHCMKGGIGHAACELEPGIWVGAIVAVNSLGDVVDPDNRNILAGARLVDETAANKNDKILFADTLSILSGKTNQKSLETVSVNNTVIGCVLTNVKLSKDEANKLAQCGQNGLVLSIQPAHTMFDGDTMFAVSSQRKNGNIHAVTAFAPIVAAQAIVNAIRFADSVGGIPAARDFLSTERE